MELGPNAGFGPACESAVGAGCHYAPNWGGSCRHRHVHPDVATNKIAARTPRSSALRRPPPCGRTAPRASREGKVPTTCLAPTAAPSPCHDNEEPGQPSTGGVHDADTNDPRQALRGATTAMIDYLQAVFAMLGPERNATQTLRPGSARKRNSAGRFRRTTNRSLTPMHRCRSTGTSLCPTPPQSGGTWARGSARHQKRGPRANGSPPSLGRTMVLASSVNSPSSVSEPPRASCPSPPPIKELRSS